MKKYLLLCLIMLSALSLLGANDLAEGFWKSIDDETGKTTAAWRIYQKDSKLYGEIVTVPDQADTVLATKCKESYKDFPIPGDVSKMTVVNTPFIFGLKSKEPGVWAGGNIIDPKDGKMYKCKITFHKADGKEYKQDTLQMRGEIGLGIGRSQYWERISEEEIENLRKK